MKPRDQRLKVNEIFVSIQGESTFAGLPCLFVRLTGCPLRCHWCDSEYAFYHGSDLTVSEVIERIASHGVELVEITGGEPLAQRGASLLMSALCDQGKTVLLETSGAFDISVVDSRVHVIMDIKCPDSGEAERTYWANLERLSPKDEVKFVVASHQDYQYACELISRHQLPQRCTVLFSAVHEQLDLKSLAEWILADRLDVRLQLQLHKFIWPGQERGI